MRFGWGDAVYGGVAQAGAGTFPAATYHVSYKNAKGEEGIVLPILLPTESMNRFAKELDHMLGNRNQNQNQNQPTTSSPNFIMSTL